MAHLPEKRKRGFQIRLATMVVVTLMIGVFMPLVIFFLHDAMDEKAGLGLGLAVVAGLLFTGFAALLTEVVCAWQEGDMWS